jgi:hypothetical protein
MITENDYFSYIANNNDIICTIKFGQICIYQDTYIIGLLMFHSEHKQLNVVCNISIPLKPLVNPAEKQ